MKGGRSIHDLFSIGRARARGTRESGSGYMATPRSRAAVTLTPHLPRA